VPHLIQNPPPGTCLLACAGDVLVFSLHLDPRRSGTAFLRANLGGVDLRREEIIAHTEHQRPFLASDWHDIPMPPAGEGTYEVRVPVLHPGWFSAKACFIPARSTMPEWPDGENVAIKVVSASTACANSLYTAFVRQFTTDRQPFNDPGLHQAAAQLDQAGYAVIPPSGTFRNLVGKLDFIIGTLGFRIIQLLPIHPTPTTFARMGRFGSPFAGLDFLAVDPAYAEFDTRTTPLDQFRELADAVHARGARLLLDLPANHTGWASTLQTHHPEWFMREADGAFKSPGAWGTVWADLVELDYRNPKLRAAMAEVFLFWCRQGADGFRCDAGYMIPAETWRYIVARVRQAYPETLFLLEGLGGRIEATQELLTEANLDWAYSELFQEESREAIERYLPDAIARSQTAGPLIHFAETHDNNRLASHGGTYARMRTALAALLSQSGAFGITNGVEWLATEKIDVHGAPALNWDAADNQVAAIARLNRLLARHPAFGFGATVRIIERGCGNVLVARREYGHGHSLLVVVNLNAKRAQTAEWPTAEFPASHVWDLLAGHPVHPQQNPLHAALDLTPGEVKCLTTSPADLALLDDASPPPLAEPEALRVRRRNLLALCTRCCLTGDSSLPPDQNPNDLGAALAADPLAFCDACTSERNRSAKAPHPLPLPAVITWNWPQDLRRTVMVPPGFLLLVRADVPFRITLVRQHAVIGSAASIRLDDGAQATLLMPSARRSGGNADTRPLTLQLTRLAPSRVEHAEAPILDLGTGDDVAVRLRISGGQIRSNNDYALLTNGCGALAQIRAAWGTVRSQYDALLAVNPNPRVPDNRLIFFTRCRAWVRYRGYSCALDATCTDWFEADPGGTEATWRFVAPVGMGKRVVIRFTAALTYGCNRLELRLHRECLPGSDGEAFDNHEPITVILRPDIESRDFHVKTQAFTGPERHFPNSVLDEPHGFCFRPSPQENYRIAADSGRFHPEPAWSYAVPHPDEVERGLGPHTDLFSPGWFEIALKGDAKAVLTAATEADFDRAESPLAATLVPGSAPLRSFEETLRRALDTFIVKRDTRHTVIAGYPWFLDWGRDTLIFLRGLIADGRAAEALEILCEFGRLEAGGTLPNMIRGEDHGNRDTSDAPFWFMVAARDAIGALGADAVLGARCGTRPLREVLASIVHHCFAGMSNGIRVDPDSGLVFSPAHYTWMDTNHPAATPRSGYPVEIQALWIAGLAMIREVLGDPRHAEAEARARASLLRLFVLPQGWLADTLRAGPGQGAAEGVAEDALRPNQLLAVTLGAVPATGPVARAVVRACEQLLVPGAIRSLADLPVAVPQPVAGHTGGLLNDPMHPYWRQYLGDEDTRRKPAYHNGTAWGWPFPLFCEAWLTVYGDAARAPARALLASARELLETGCVGNLPEIIDGDTPHAQRGCGAQAWSVSELLRVWQLCQPR
jgi:starch synthase (maltosyl-transferring)